MELCKKIFVGFLCVECANANVCSLTDIDVFSLVEVILLLSFFVKVTLNTQHDGAHVVPLVGSIVYFVHLREEHNQLLHFVITMDNSWNGRES